MTNEDDDHFDLSELQQQPQMKKHESHATQIGNSANTMYLKMAGTTSKEKKRGYLHKQQSQGDSKNFMIGGGLIASEFKKNKLSGLLTSDSKRSKLDQIEQRSYADQDRRLILPTGKQN